MRVENETTEHNRTLHFTDLPHNQGGLSELYVVTAPQGESNIKKAIAIDSVIIPTIIEAINTPRYPVYYFDIRCRSDRGSGVTVVAAESESEAVTLLEGGTLTNNFYFTHPSSCDLDKGELLAGVTSVNKGVLVWSFNWE